MTTDVTAYLRRQAMEPFAWGRRDCGLFIADWIVARRGVDPCAGSRGTYDDAAGAAKHHAAWGGLARAVGRALAGIGLQRTRTPTAGDVGVIFGGGRVVCAVKTETGWAMRLDEGIAFARDDRVRVVAAWRV